MRKYEGKSVHWPIYVAIARGAAAIVLGLVFHESSKRLMGSEESNLIGSDEDRPGLNYHAKSVTHISR